MKTTLLSILLCVSCLVFGQDEKPENEHTIRKNSIYLELGGNAFYYSVNYERIILTTNVVHLSLRAGYGTSIEYFGEYSIIPMELNLLFGKKFNFFEIGYGQTLAMENSSYADEPDRMITFRLGYRHISGQGLMVRAGIVPILNEYDKIIRVGLGIGYAF